MPPSGSGRDPSLHTLGGGSAMWGERREVGGSADGGMLPSLQVWGRSEDHLGPSLLPQPLLGKVQCPFLGHLPPASCAGMNQLSQLVKAGPLVFMPSPQETELQIFQLHSAGGQGPYFINISSL